MKSVLFVCNSYLAIYNHVSRHDVLFASVLGFALLLVVICNFLGAMKKSLKYTAVTN